MKFRKINLEENIEYDAKIVSWSIDNDKRFFRVFAEIAGLDGSTFMKCIRYAEFAPSTLSNFCEMFEIVERNGDVDFDELLDAAVVVTLSKGRDGNFYISDIYPVGDDDDVEE